MITSIKLIKIDFRSLAFECTILHLDTCLLSVGIDVFISRNRVQIVSYRLKTVV